MERRPAGGQAGQSVCGRGRLDTAAGRKAAADGSGEVGVDEPAARPEDPCHFGESARPVGDVVGGLARVDEIELSVSKRQGRRVRNLEPNLGNICTALRRGSDLSWVDIDTNDAQPERPGHMDRSGAVPTANIERSLPWPRIDRIQSSFGLSGDMAAVTRVVHKQLLDKAHLHLKLLR